METLSMDTTNQLFCVTLHLNESSVKDIQPICAHQFNHLYSIVVIHLDLKGLHVVQAPVSLNICKEEGVNVFQV